MSSFLNFSEGSMPTANMAFPQISSTTSNDLGANLLACSIFILAVLFMSDNLVRRKSHQALYTPSANKEATEAKGVQAVECGNAASSPQVVKSEQSGEALSLFDGLSLGAVMALRA